MGGFARRGEFPRSDPAGVALPGWGFKKIGRKVGKWFWAPRGSLALGKGTLLVGQHRFGEVLGSPVPGDDTSRGVWCHLELFGVKSPGSHPRPLGGASSPGRSSACQSAIDFIDAGTLPWCGFALLMLAVSALAARQLITRTLKVALLGAARDKSQPGAARSLHGGSGRSSPALPPPRPLPSLQSVAA